MYTQIEKRDVVPLVTPRKGVRVGSIIHVGDSNLLEVKNKGKEDYITTNEIIEQMEGRKVKAIVFEDSI